MALIEKGFEADADEAQALIQKHFLGIKKFYIPTREVYIDLGELYLTHPDLAEFLARGMQLFADRELS